MNCETISVIAFMTLCIILTLFQGAITLPHNFSRNNFSDQSLFQERKVDDDLGVCVLSLQIVLEKSKSLVRPRDKKDLTLWKEAPYCM